MRSPPATPPNWGEEGHPKGSPAAKKPFGHKLAPQPEMRAQTQHAATRARHSDDGGHNDDSETLHTSRCVAWGGWGERMTPRNARAVVYLDVSVHRSYVFSPSRSISKVSLRPNSPSSLIEWGAPATSGSAKATHLPSHPTQPGPLPVPTVPWAIPPDQLSVACPSCIDPELAPCLTVSVRRSGVEERQIR